MFWLNLWLNLYKTIANHKKQKSYYGMHVTFQVFQLTKFIKFLISSIILAGIIPLVPANIKIKYYIYLCHELGSFIDAGLPWMWVEIRSSLKYLAHLLNRHTIRKIFSSDTASQRGLSAVPRVAKVVRVAVLIYKLRSSSLGGGSNDVCLDHRVYSLVAWDV